MWVMPTVLPKNGSANFFVIQDPRATWICAGSAARNLRSWQRRYERESERRRQSLPASLRHAGNCSATGCALHCAMCARTIPSLEVAHLSSSAQILGLVKFARNSSAKREAKWALL